MQYIFRRRSTVPLNGNGRVEFPLLSVQLRGKASRYFSFLPAILSKIDSSRHNELHSGQKNLQSHCIKNWQMGSWSRNEKKRSVTVKLNISDYSDIKRNCRYANLLWIGFFLGIQNFENTFFYLPKIIQQTSKM